MFARAITIRWLGPALAALLLGSSPVAADHAANPVPTAIDGVQTVDAAGVVELVRARDDLIILDSRIRADREMGFIPGSLSLVDSDTTCASLTQHVGEASRPLLFYDNGLQCGRSVTAIHIAIGCGYENIHWYRAGFAAWADRRLPLAYD